MELQEQRDLQVQLFESFQEDPSMRNKQDHGLVTGNEEEDAVQDVMLQRAVKILREEALWDNILRKYHRDVRETQVAAADGEEEG